MTAEPEAMLPTPFTAPQIQAAMKPGLEIRFEILAGERPKVISVWSVLGNEDAGLRFEQSTVAADGSTVLEGPKTGPATPWEELRRHAEFPSGNTERREAPVSIPTLGTFDGWLYTRTESDGDQTTVSTFHFAKDLPGPPVVMTTDIDGVRQMQMTMVRRSGLGDAN